MKNLFLLFIVFLSLQVNSFTQQEYFKEDQPQRILTEGKAGAIDVTLDSLMLDSIITAYKNSLSIPGIASLIIKNDQVIWNKNYGYRDVQLQLPVEDSTLFAVCSISKTFIGTAVMQLWENGLIELDNNINDYLPAGFSVVNPFFPNDSITVKMLLTHSSSIADYWAILEPFESCGDSPLRLDSTLIQYFTPGGSYYSISNFNNSHPGQSWYYSSPGSCLLALIIENLTGQSFDEYTRDNILTPLSMHSSSWFLEGLDTSQIAVPYIGTSPGCHKNNPLYPITQLRSNKFELSNYISAYLNSGKYNNNRILDSTTVSLMLSDQLGFPTTDGYLQGLIWYIEPQYGADTWGHSGKWSGYITQMLLDKNENWGLVFFLNTRLYDYAGLLSTLYSLVDYANLYGNIYANTPKVDKGYARIGIDNVLFRTTFSNIYDHQFNAHLIYSNSDGIILDSVLLYDDGIHGDSLSNDGIYGGYIPPQQAEDFYSIGVSTIDNQTNKYFSTPDLCKFTTVPLQIDSIQYNALTNYRYSFKPFLKNTGSIHTIEDVTVKLTSNDPWVTLIFPEGGRGCPNLLPGEVKGVVQPFAVTYDSATFPGYFHLKFEIMSNGWTYWTDQTEVIVGVEDEFNEVPTDFVLSQNFPNPFNPVTTIKYQIPYRSNVSLKIYDIIGNEVADLINEEQAAGFYNIDFNAAKLSSGVYFYRIQAGGFVQTKKMLLLK